MFALDGPAKNIFKQKIGDFKNNKIEKIITMASKLICGTSWQSDLEFEALRLAKINNINI